MGDRPPAAPSAAPEGAGNLQSYLHASPALVVVLDAAGRILELNQAGAELLGVDAGAIRGGDWLAFVPPERRADVLRVLEAVVAGDLETFASYQNDLITARGERRTLLWRNAVLRAPGGAAYACIATGLDVTAQWELEGRLAASEARLHALAERSRDVLWTLDLATRRFTYVSPSILGLRGVTPEQALAEPLGASLTPESRARMEVVAARIGTPAEEDPHIGVYDQLHADGSIRHVEITTSVQRDGAGRPVAVVGISRDATERVRAERALRQSETIYRSLFEASPSGVILVDLEGRVLTFNDTAASRLGYTREEFQRLKVWEIDAEDDQRVVGERIGAVLRDGSAEFDTRHRTKDGGLRDVHIKIVRVDLPDGPAVLSTWDDITESRRLERVLRQMLAEGVEREAWLQASQRAARIGHYVFDVVADVWTSSPVLDEIFGIGPGHDRSGAGWLDLVHPDDRPDMVAYLRDLMGRGVRFDKVYRVGAAGGPPRWVHGVGELERDADGRPLRLFGTIQDITARRRSEQAEAALAEQLRQAQKLESIGRLAGGVAHDFNNILVAILGCAEALHQSVEEGRPPAAADVEELQEAALRAKDLTSQLLAFARKQVVAPAVLDLNLEVRRAERMLQRILGEDVRLELALQPGLPAVTFDPGQLQQVLMNLAVNARDAMPVGGRLAISTGFAAPEPAAEGEGPGWRGAPAPASLQVRLLVEDTGQGIPPELWPRVFEPFVTTKEAGHGTGLGLATVYGIVQQAGGVVRFRSTPGRGAAFELLLPPAAAVAAPPAPPRRAAPGAARPGERLLVVEDDDLVRAAASRALRAAGFEVTVASGGDEVLALVARGDPPPHLLLTDVVMPGMNGKQVAEACQAAWPGVRVLFMSGYAQDIIVHHGVVDPGLDLLEKPFTSDGLVTRVRAALDR